MNPSTSLTGRPQRTYEAIFRHPIAHSVAWRDILVLLGHLGQVAQETNGNLRITRHGQTLVLPPPHAKEITEPSELLELRHFLERSEKSPPEVPVNESRWLVVIDHQEARIFHSELPGSAPGRILSHAPDRYFRHAPHSKDFSRGREKPDPNSFCAPVAQALSDAGKILIFGCGTGAGSEMEQFIAWLKQHHPDLAGRIIGSLIVDQHHLTEAQLLAKAREFYAHDHSAAGAQS